MRKSQDNSVLLSKIAAGTNACMQASMQLHATAVSRIESRVAHRYLASCASVAMQTAWQPCSYSRSQAASQQAQTCCSSLTHRCWHLTRLAGRPALLHTRASLILLRQRQQMQPAQPPSVKQMHSWLHRIHQTLSTALQHNLLLPRPSQHPGRGGLLCWRDV